MKTFALIVYLITSDGSSSSYFEDTGLSSTDCAAALIEGVTPQPQKAFKGGRKIETVVLACEEEIEV